MICGTLWIPTQWNRLNERCRIIRGEGQGRLEVASSVRLLDLECDADGVPLPSGTVQHGLRPDTGLEGDGGDLWHRRLDIESIGVDVLGEIPVAVLQFDIEDEGP